MKRPKSLTVTLLYLAALALVWYGCGPATEMTAPVVEVTATPPPTAPDEPTVQTSPFPGGTGTAEAKSTCASTTLTSQVITPPSPTQPEPDYVWISSQGLKLRLNSRLASGWKAGVSSGEGIYPVPEHRFIEVGCCVLSGGRQDIQIISIEDYKRVASWFEPPLSDRINQMKELFTKKPAQLPFDLDFLPQVNAGTMMNAKPGYLDFQNGSGIRYLTVFHQDPLAVTNQELLYVFQGITTDGRYLVAGRFSIDSRLLPDDGLTSPTDVDYDTYLNQVESQLTQADASSFYPNLTLLDEMMRSLAIGQ